MRRSAYVSFLRSLLFPNFMNDEYQCRNSETAYAFDASFPEENFQPNASASPESIRPLRWCGAWHPSSSWGVGRVEN
ncbi:hypothetical protein NYE54_08590 [Paenibacillus sp. FSL K6-1330]|uniref:hypothetical protein n=1 Tax=Paenibacillus sp. FSL K6-1330 TaxID=2975292 RepID=UPI0030D6FE21